MASEDWPRRVSAFVQQDELSNALELLMEIAESTQMSLEVTALYGRHTAFRKKVRQGVYSAEQESLESSRIRAALLDLSEELEIFTVPQSPAGGTAAAAGPPLADGQSMGDSHRFVEAVIAEFEVDPVASRGELYGQWRFEQAGVHLNVILVRGGEENDLYLQASVPILKIRTGSANENALLRELLEINDRVLSCSFMIYSGWVWMKGLREMKGISKEDAVNLVYRTGFYAARYIGGLREKYAGR